jgi:hypothetical protein
MSGSAVKVAPRKNGNFSRNTSFTGPDCGTNGTKKVGILQFRGRLDAEKLRRFDTDTSKHSRVLQMKEMLHNEMSIVTSRFVR